MLEPDKSFLVFEKCAELAVFVLDVYFAGLPYGLVARLLVMDGVAIWLQLVHALRMFNPTGRLDLFPQIEGLYPSFAVTLVQCRGVLFGLVVGVQTIHLILDDLVLEFALFDEFLELVEVVAVVSLEHVEATRPDVGVVYRILLFNI